MDTNIDILEKENKRLSEQLQNAKKWMQSEVEWAHKIIKNKKWFLWMIEEKIYNFFPPEALMHFPSNGIENIISSELIYKHLIEGDQIDGTGVVMWYQKILDSMVELYITKWFRKYISKKYRDVKVVNDPLEKSLMLVYEKKHILSLWRLYQILKHIREDDTLKTYTYIFWEYLKSRPFLEKALLETDFFLQLQQLVHLHVLTEKRHSWTLSLEDTKISRYLCNWDLENTNCLLYTLASAN